MTVQAAGQSLGIFFLQTGTAPCCVNVADYGLPQVGMQPDRNNRSHEPEYVPHAGTLPRYPRTGHDRPRPLDDKGTMQINSVRMSGLSAKANARQNF